MRRFLRAFSAYRPRLLTVLLLTVVAALLMLANLSVNYSACELMKRRY